MFGRKAPAFLTACNIPPKCDRKGLFHFSKHLRLETPDWTPSSSLSSFQKMVMRARFTSADPLRNNLECKAGIQIVQLKQRAQSKGSPAERHTYTRRILVGLFVLGIWAVFDRLPCTYIDLAEDLPPTITIFSAPVASMSSSYDSLQIVKERQQLAVRSWLAMSPDVSIVLFGQHPSTFAFAEALGPRVSVEAGIDFSFSGTPFFHSMIHKMLAYKSDISVLVKPHVVILPDFLPALHLSYKLDRDWLLVSVSQDNGEPVNLKKELMMVGKHQSNCSKRILFAWNRGTVPLQAGVLPPFLYGKGIHDCWLMGEVLASDFRVVVDASEAISTFYPDMPECFSSTTMWENGCNYHLAYTYGSLFLHSDLESNNMVQLLKLGGRYTITDTSESKVKSLQAPKLQKERWNPLMLSDDFEIPSQPSLPFSLKSLLESVADEHRTVVLTIAGESYKDMLMSWVCRLRRLSVRNFLVSAIDMETYQFSVLQGLPVFMDTLAPRNISFNHCHFGSDCFQKVTKVKSRLVLQILKLGYNALLSDVDVFWFRNPLPYLRSFGPAVLLAQSDEYNETGPINLPRRLNSGFYFARSDHPTISAMEKVVKHASMSGSSEQPSFYDVLCGGGGSNRIGDDGCFEPQTNLTVHFLDRHLFPNGAFQGLWESNHVKAACKKKRCFILHNNWISGRQRKLNRQLRSGLFAYSLSSRTCLRSFHKGQKKGFDGWVHGL